MPRPANRRPAAVAVAALTVLLLSLLLAGCSDTAPAAPPSGGAAAPAPAAAPQPVVTLTVTELGIVDQPLVPLGLNPDQTIAVPPVSQPEQVGYYDLGPRPGQPGPAIVLGHVNGGGRPGAFANLDRLDPGDRFTTHDATTATTWQVTREQRVPKDQFPTSAVYSDTPTPELRLITCGGVFLGEDYADNVIVYATKTP